MFGVHPAAPSSCSAMLHCFPKLRKAIEEKDPVENAAASGQFQDLTSYWCMQVLLAGNNAAAAKFLPYCLRRGKQLSYVTPDSDYIPCFAGWAPTRPGCLQGVSAPPRSPPCNAQGR